MKSFRTLIPMLALLAATGCVAEAGGDSSSEEVSTDTAPLTSAIRHVFVIAMENHQASDIYGNTADAPYLNTLMHQYAYAGASSAHDSNYGDVVAASVPSEPHYIWLEGGTNVFSDHTFTTDGTPSGSNSTKSHEHLVNKLQTAGVSWRAYEEGLDSTTGLCPVKNHYDTANVSAYAARHDPFVFFQDVAFTNGNPDPNNAACKSHMSPLSSLAGDLAAGSVASYAFITPNLCHDMHVQGCGNQTETQKLKAGDTWLSHEMPALISYAKANHGVIFIVWDEPEGGTHLPFLVVGPNLRSAGYKSTKTYSHSSVVKSLQRILEVSPAEGVPYLGHAGDSGVNDFADFFTAGSFP